MPWWGKGRPLGTNWSSYRRMGKGGQTDAGGHGERGPGAEIKPTAVTTTDYSQFDTGSHLILRGQCGV
jgi:hypothetical protein